MGNLLLRYWLRISRNTFFFHYIDQPGSVPIEQRAMEPAENLFINTNEYINPTFTANSKGLIFKRFSDILLGLVCLFLCAPVILLIAIIVMLNSPGNPFFTQVRVGRNGKRFIIFKMRTLFIHHFGIVPNQEAPDAHRITWIGKYLRRSKLDELPQLVNIVMGQMSFVGPRPDIPEQANRYTRFQQQRLCVKPGLTGISQVSGNTLLSWPDRIVLDIWYIKNRSLLLDLKIIMFTITAIVKGEKQHADPFQSALLTARQRIIDDYYTGHI